MIWLIQEDGQYGVRRTDRKETGAVEYVKAKDYNDLVDWAGGNQLCVWTEDIAGSWQTECGNAFEFTEGGPKENGARYCQYCRGTLLRQNYERNDPNSGLRTRVVW